MSGPNPAPLLNTLDSEPSGYCEPGSDSCVLPRSAVVDKPEDGSKDGSTSPDKDS